MPKDEKKKPEQATLWNIDDRKFWEKEWHGMPEFVQENLEAVKSIKVNFLKLEDYEAFCRAINQVLTPQTKSIWFPEVIKGKNANKIYTDFADTIETEIEERIDEDD
jgi:hypothetical protein